MPVAWPALWFDLPLAVFDLETTGFDPAVCEILEVGIVLFYRGEVVKTLNWLVDPGCKIPDEIVKLTHIEQKDVDGQPKFADIARDILGAFDGHGIVAYNIGFDRPFLTAKLQAMGLDWPQGNPLLDPLVFATHFYPKERNKLGMVVERLGLKLEGAHRACNDAEATGRVLYAFRDRLPAELQELLVVQAEWERENQERLQWRRKPGVALSNPLLTQSNNGVLRGALPGFEYGNEPDPLRAIYSAVPNKIRGE